MEKDMTAGTPGKIIFNFTMPIFIGNIFQQFYNMTDTVIVGKFVGNAALAAVGACGTLVFLIIGFLQGVTAGFTVGEGAASDEYTVRHVWRSLRIYYGHLRRDCGTDTLQLSCKCIKGTGR